MILRPTSRRAGASLVEVLVGFGILGIGVTSVITLFPFSALTLGQALKDDRTTTCAAMADGQMRDVHQHYVVEPDVKEDYFGRFSQPGTPGLTDPMFNLSPSEPGPSYPVYVDPMGVFARSPTDGAKASVGDGGVTKIPRVNLSFLTSSDLMALRYCSLMDSLTFDENGQVDQDPTKPSKRELRYNYAWMLQRPRNNDPFTVRMQVVVYNRRAHLYAPAGSEAVYPANFRPGETTITVTAPMDNIRKGTWVMDGTIDSTNKLRHAEFYRVASVTAGSGTTTLLEVHKPVSRADGLTDPTGSGGYLYSGNLVVMPGVADVFERPMLTGKH